MGKLCDRLNQVYPINWVSSSKEYYLDVASARIGKTSIEVQTAFGGRTFTRIHCVCLKESKIYELEWDLEKCLELIGDRLDNLMANIVHISVTVFCSRN